MDFDKVKLFCSRNSDRLIIAAWVISVFVVFLPGLVAGDRTPKIFLWFGEMAILNLPHWDFTSSMLKAGFMPTWTPHIYCGFPHSAFPSTSFYYYPFYLLMHLDYTLAASLEAFIYFSLGGTFAFFGFRRLGMSPAAALVGLMASVGSTWAIFNSSHFWGEREILALALCGWSAANMLKGSFRYRYWLGMVFGLYILLSNNPEMFIYMAIFFVCLSFVQGSWAFRVRHAVLTASAIFAVYLVVAPVFLGLVQYMPFTIRSQGITFEYFTHNALGPKFFAGIVSPLPFVFSGYQSPWYLGLSVLWLGVLFALRHGRRTVPIIASVLLIVILCMDMKYLTEVIYRIPVLNRMLLRYNLFPAALLLVAFLAGRGADDFIETGFRSRWAWLVPVFIGLALAAGSLKFRGPLIVIPVAAAAAAFFRPSLLDSPTRRSIWVVAFVALDMTILSFVLKPWTQMDHFDLHPEARQFLERQTSQERFWTLSSNLMNKDPHLNPNIGMRLDPFLPGTSSPLGYLRMAPMRTTRLINLISPGYLEFKDGKLNKLDRPRPAGPDPFGPKAEHLLSLMNVGWILSNRVELSGFKSLERRPGEKLIFYSNNSVLPRVRTISRWRVARDADESLAAVGSGDMDFSNEAILEAKAGTLKDSPGLSTPHKAWVRESRPGYWEIDLRPGEGGRPEKESALIVAETLTPGWRAFLDGNEVPVHFAYHAFMGVVVPPGPHRIIMYHAPRAFRIGIWVSICSMLCWPATWLGWRKRKS